MGSEIYIFEIMDVNELVAKLKVSGTKDDLRDVDRYYKEYKTVVNKLNNKDRGIISLNVLCIICRNFDKVPSWIDSIESKDLLTLCIDCIRETRGMDQPERIKTLACIFHIHRNFVKKNTQVPPELLLKISYMAFESDTKDMLREYGKTYCSIVLDRIAYLEKLKGIANINKLLPKLIEDILKTIDIYNTVQFCSSFLIFLVKKLQFLYNCTCPEQLNETLCSIFTKLSTKTDIKSFKNLTEKELAELYSIMNNCIYLIAENLLKCNSEIDLLDLVVRTFVAMIGHIPDFYHCLQTFYVNSFCCILTNKCSGSYVDTVLNGMLLAFETTEKLGYIKAMYTTYPFLSQLLRLYIEKFSGSLSSQAQEICLKITVSLMKKLRKCTQFLKCENCNISTGVHDSVRLTFAVKNLICNALEGNSDIEDILNAYLILVKEQNISLRELGRSGCVNYANFFNKSQADIHNIAILLSNVQHYKHSIELFETYLKLEMMHFKTENELKNISRALYNKSICELNYKLYEAALLNAFLSLLFARLNGISTDKYMNLVIDVKSKALKENEEEGSLQLISILESCKIALHRSMYGNIKPFLVNIKFSAFLRHEFDMYAKMWPSVAPIAGVWNSLMELTDSAQPDWITREDNYILRWTLYEVILETPTVVRMVQNDHYKMIVTKLLSDFDENLDASSDHGVVYATLMFLKAEYDMADAADKHRWNVAEPNIDPDQFQGVRSIPEEYAASRRALQAVDMWTALSKTLDKVMKKSCLRHSLQISQLFVQQLLRLYCKAEALQLAHVCCLVAKHLGDVEAYVRNAGVLLRHVTETSEELNAVMIFAGESWGQLISSADNLEVAIVFLCDSAIYHKRCGLVGTSAKLVQLAQARVLSTNEKFPEVNLDLAIGRLLEAQNILCGETGPSALFAVNSAQRHYLSVGTTLTKWTSRRLRGLTIKYHTCLTSIGCVNLARALRVWRRARSTCGAALLAASAPAQAELFALITNSHHYDDALVKIDNRLKYILGIQNSNKTKDYVNTDTAKDIPISPKQDVEMMLDSFVLKRVQSSPTLPCIVPRFKVPEFFYHNVKCQCHCQLPAMYILACQTSSLEASMYFRANECSIAEDYFKGTLKMLDIAEARSFPQRTNEKYLHEFVVKSYKNELRRVRLEFLIEMAFFELSKRNFEAGDDLIVSIHELTELGSTDQYLMNEILNLMIATAKLRGIIKKPDINELMIELEDLKLSPTVEVSTPANKGRMPQAGSMKVKDDEVMKRRKVIKLNLDETDEKEPSENKPKFKIPVPVTSKPILENITPKPTRSRPQILLTQPSIEIVTPKVTPNVKEKKREFFTPLDSPEQFFTPVPIKTYSKSKKSAVVKNLEQEFATPVGKENERRSRSKESLRMLKRATSPGKLEKETGLQIRTRSQRKVKLDSGTVK